MRERQVIGRIEGDTVYAEPPPEPDWRTQYERLVEQRNRERERSERHARQRIAVMFGVGIVYGAVIASFGS